MNKGVRIEGRVRDIVQSGDAVVETERGVVFVRGALLDERVVVSIDPKSKKPLRGRVLSVLTPSEQRVDAPCRHALRCGGCPLMHMSLDAQRALKAKFLRDALVKAGAPADLTVQHTLANETLAYRRRARLAFRNGRGPGQLGYRRESSHDLADVDSCIVLHPALQAVFPVLRTQLLPLLAGDGEVSLALGPKARAVVVIRTSAVQQPVLYSTCAQLVEGDLVDGIALFAAGASKPALFGDATEYSEARDGMALEGAIGGFSQAHAEINRALVERVVELVAAPGAHVLELYAGHGNFTVELAHNALSYTAVEQDGQSVAALRKNLAARKLTAKVIEGDARTYALPAGLDVALLDPPRSGAAGLLTRLGERKVKRIVYVSCDPQTLARDVGELLDKGYRISSVEAFEMFPQTADLESVVSLTRV